VRARRELRRWEILPSRFVIFSIGFDGGLIYSNVKDPIYLRSLFTRAVARHIQYSTWAAAGQGVDRHLFGLRRLLRAGERVPEIYTDPAYARSSHWEMSTSQLISLWFDGWGYGQGACSFFLCIHEWFFFLQNLSFLIFLGW
jgi:hypothetical protein